MRFHISVHTVFNGFQKSRVAFEVLFHLFCKFFPFDNNNPSSALSFGKNALIFEKKDDSFMDFILLSESFASI